MVVTAMQLSTLPQDVPSLGAPVYQYMDVTPAHFTSVTSAVIGFEVAKSWIEEQHITPANVALSRFHGGAWANLSTSFVREANGHAYYQAESPGFSIFAIIAVKGSAIREGGVADVTPGKTTVPVTTLTTQVPPTVRKSIRNQTTLPVSPVQTPQQSPLSLMPIIGICTAIFVVQQTAVKKIIAGNFFGDVPDPQIL